MANELNLLGLVQLAQSVKNQEELYQNTQFEWARDGEFHRKVLYSWGESSNLVLGYPSHTQGAPRLVEFPISPYGKQE